MEAINSAEPLGEPGKGGVEAEETNKTPAGEQTTIQGKWQIHLYTLGLQLFAGTNFSNFHNSLI